MKAPEGACKEGHDTFQGSSGYRLIPGNTCVQRDGVVKDEPVERKCDQTKTPPATGEINTEITTFKGEQFVEYYYLERCETCEGDDETVIMRTDRREAYLSSDHGKHWAPVQKGEDIVAIYPHEHNNDRVYVVTPTKTVFYSDNRGRKFHHFEAPEVPNVDHLQILGFHPKRRIGSFGLAAATATLQSQIAKPSLMSPNVTAKAGSLFSRAFANVSSSTAKADPIPTSLCIASSTKMKTSTNL